MTRQVPSSADYALLELTNPSGLRIQLRPDGEIFALRHGATLLNQIIPTPAECGMRRLVLRARNTDPFHIVNLTGPASVLSQITARQVCWAGHTTDWEHTVLLTLHPAHAGWTWQVRIRNQAPQARTFDLLHGQDLGLADEAGVRGNEAYLSQYIDHFPVPHPRWGTVLLARQNMPQAANAHPWLAQGCLTGSVAFATDGYPFFGRSHRLTGEPQAYQMERLPSQRLQYECAYASLQTAPVTLPPGGTWETTFFAVYQPDHAAASSAADLEAIASSLDLPVVTVGTALRRPPDATADGRPKAVPTGNNSLFFSPPLAGDELTERDWIKMFPGAHRQIERDADGNRLSFFLGDARHVVSRRKELLVDRPHGHLLRSGQTLGMATEALGSTVYACGIFNAQVYLGNTNLARLLSVVRNPLDVMASSGQRVFIRRSNPPQGRAGPASREPADRPDPPPAVETATVPPSPCPGAWQRLGASSAFEIGLNQARWLYCLGDTCIEARTVMDAQSPSVSLTLRVLSGAPCEFLVSHLLVLGDREMDQAFSMDVDPAAARITCAPDPKTLLGEKCPALHFVISASPADVLACGGDELLFADNQSRGAPYAVIQSKPVQEFGVRIEGLLTNQPTPRRKHHSKPLLTTGLPQLCHPAAAHVAEILPWFAHNACTHFTAPRGLEQYGGAAWGVRDVCQGPVEWLLATRQFAAVRQALKQVFAQQYADSGCWPQWFMFDPFRFIQSSHAHGDVPFWPVKALCDYIEATADFAFLSEEVPYTDPKAFTATTCHDTLLAHALRVVDVHAARCIPGTSLVNYGDGDWDDTLQPADPSLRANMTSAWTVGLAYHTFRKLHEVCQRAGLPAETARLAALLPAIQADFQRLLLPDNVLAGFLVFGDGAPRPLLHPQDRVTGIRYRLLPMTRAMLAELLTPEQAEQHLALIRTHLLFPDGVRLMSDPVPYCGGVERWFKRAETAANFGREIGLMYTHAHLRYIEALAKLGHAEEMWEMLGRVTPVQLRERVANAAPRQANAFFSSSDGAFPDRYAAAARFDDLRRGAMEVKGGWRIYSSGPGLYIHRVICSLLGIRDSFGDLVLDPVLPRALDGLIVQLVRDGHPIEFRYRVGERGSGVRQVCVNGRDLPLNRRDPNPYRIGGARVATHDFTALLRKGANVVEIEVG
ncbi:MAG: GH36-type glycosyl hydrolase domain-containing protein [Kiritimatiellia bacterium]